MESRLLPVTAIIVHPGRPAESGTGTGSAAAHAAAALAAYLAIQATVVLVIGYHPRVNPAGIGWAAITAVVI